MKIYYTGIGAKKSGKHGEKEFMNIMKSTFNKECAYHKKSLTCSSCKKSKSMNEEYIKKVIKASKQKKTYRLSKTSEKKLVQQSAKCNKCQTRKTKKCNLDEYIVFSGAEKLN